MAANDLITWKQLLRTAPRLLPQLPKIIDGIKLTRLDDPSIPVGLALEFEAAAVDNPKAVAILGPNQRITYTQANRIANQIAQGLKNQGIHKGDVVGIYLENRPELLLFVLACAKIGAIAAMMNTEKKKELLLQSFQLVSPKMIIVSEGLLSPLNRVIQDLHELEKLVIMPKESLTNPRQLVTKPQKVQSNSPFEVLDAHELYINQPTSNHESSKKIYLHDPLFYLFTSGTSGMPKAGVFTHGRWMKLYGGIGKFTTDLTRHDVLYANMPLYHATALCVCWSAVIAAKAGFAVGRRFSASGFWNETQRFHATAIGYVGDLCQFLLVQPTKEIDTQHPVRMMLGNGLRPAIWSQFKHRFNMKTVYEFYGASDGNVGFFNLLNLENTVGFSPNRFAIVAIDDDDYQPIRGENGFFIRVKTGEVGLLISEINTHFPLDGYTEKSETDKIIIKSAFETGDRWLNTGDLMRDLGFRHTQFIDRIGDSYRWHGENVATQEVESMVRKHSIVKDAVVYGVKVPSTSGKAGMLTMSLMSTAIFDRKQRRQFLSYLKSRLPSYAIPRFIRLAKSLNTTATFKFKKTKYQKEGFNPADIKDDLYIYHLDSNNYELLTPALFEKIEQGKLKL